MNRVYTPFSRLQRSLGLAAWIVVGCTGTLVAQTALVSDSPFAPKGTEGAVGGSAPAEAYELAGSTVEGSEVSVCIFERQAKRSQWIPVGAETDGVRVISYDEAHDTAVVLISGSRKELSMRRALVASERPGAHLPAVLSVPATPVSPIVASAPPTPALAAHDQREARMLVSDLLEIGIQQRKAYQDAKAKAAATPPPPDN